jgi:hypothetical protein
MTQRIMLGLEDLYLTKRLRQVRSKEIAMLGQAAQAEDVIEVEDST